MLHNVFDEDSEAICNEPVVFDGFEYKKDHRLPFKELGIPNFTLRGLHKGGKIKFTNRRYQLDKKLALEIQKERDERAERFAKAKHKESGRLHGD
jgi:hypothetical protein